MTDEFEKHRYDLMHLEGTMPASHLPAHATRHQPGGADAMAVDAAAGVGSLRTLGAGPLQGAPGDHAHPAPVMYDLLTAGASPNFELVFSSDGRVVWVPT